MYELEVKNCKVCGTIKSINEFYRIGRNREGFRSKCIDCTKRLMLESVENEHKVRTENKTCSKCLIIFSILFFSKDIYSKDGKRKQCKECDKKNNKKVKSGYKENNKLGLNVDIISKKCAKCKEIKLISMFGKNSSFKDGYQHYCKFCHKEEQKSRTFTKKKKRYFITEHIVQEKECRICMKIKPSNMFYKNSNSSIGLSTYCKRCSQSDASKRAKKRRKEDTSYRLRHQISCLIRAQFKKFLFSKNGEQTWKHLPYAPRQLKEHLESLWEPWMNWDNYGSTNKNKRTWCIDHVVPQSVLPYDSMEHINFLKCWSLNNLRPLESFANLKKSNKIIELED